MTYIIAIIIGLLLGFILETIVKYSKDKKVRFNQEEIEKVRVFNERVKDMTTPPTIKHL